MYCNIFGYRIHLLSRYLTTIIGKYFDRKPPESTSSISTRLYLNFFCFSKYDVIWQQTTLPGSKPCFTLYVIHLVVRGVFSMCFSIDVLSRMSSSLLCIYILHFLCHILVKNVYSIYDDHCRRQRRLFRTLLLF